MPDASYFVHCVQQLQFFIDHAKRRRSGRGDLVFQKHRKILHHNELVVFRDESV